MRKLRVTLAVTSIVLMTLLFLDFTGTLHVWLGWMAKMQFIPALLVSFFVVVAAIIVITLLFGRIYCSVICPLGIYQDGVARLAERRKKNRYRFKKSRKWLRYCIAIIFAILIFVGLSPIAMLIEPYSIYGSMVSNLLSPIYKLINNVLAYFAEHWNSYAFYSVDVYIKSLPIFIVSIAYFLTITVIAWRSGRGYCNTVCPVGTILGIFAKYSFFKPHFDKEKCISCGICEKNCRCSAIDSKKHVIDYSKCVTCFICVDKCPKDAMIYGKMTINHAVTKKGQDEGEGKTTRKTFLATVATLATASALKAQDKIVDGGLATIEKKKAPKRETPLKPAGSASLSNFTSRCTGCQLCVQVCRNDVLRPSNKLETFMQPEMSFERGYCRPECTACSEVCSAGAIRPVTREQKTSIQIGHAVWIGRNCIPLRDGVSCGNCARHCPSGAITMVPNDQENPLSEKVPAINEERCIGCGACEHVCPARPFSAIYVEGHICHKSI